ncbi:MAG: toprim domain-containing protein, partial [Actinomycetota bacterium]
TGHRRRWHCPHADHPDNNPSVTITTDRTGTQRWRCWSGGHGGTAIDAVIANQRLDIGEAMRWLNDHHAGPQPHEQAPQRSGGPEPCGSQSPIIADYVEHCERTLWTAAGGDVLDWLRHRGFTDDVLVANRVGADLGTRNPRRPAGVPDGHSAAVFPCLDPDGHLVYFQARFLDPQHAGMKYANPARSIAPNPKLAWHRPVTHRDDKQALVIAEGIPDGLVVAGAGIRAVSVLGAAAAHADIAQMIARSVQRSDPAMPVMVCFDADHAGHAGADALLANLELEGANAHRVVPPDGLDLNDWALRDGSWARSIDVVEPIALAARLEIDIGP